MKHRSWLVWLRRCSVILLCLAFVSFLSVFVQLDSPGLTWSLQKVKAEVEHYISGLETAIRKLRVDRIGILDSRRVRVQRDELLVLYRRALDAQDQGNLDAAIEDYSSIVAQSGVDADLIIGTLYNRGIAYDRIGEAKLALADIDRAILLAPNYGEAYQNRATIRHKGRDLVGAFEDYSKAYDLLGGDQRKFAMIGRAVVLVQSGNLRSARVDLATALFLDPEFDLARKLLRDVDAGLEQGVRTIITDGPGVGTQKSQARSLAVAGSANAGAQDNSEMPEPTAPPAQEREAFPVPMSERSKSGEPSYFVQLGALASESAAEALAGRSRSNLQEIGGNIELQILQGTAANGRVVYRVWAGPVAGSGQARQLCKDLKAISRDCFVIRPEAAGDDKT